MFVMERKSLLNDKRIAMKTYVQPQTKTLAVRPLLLSASTEGKTETMPLNPGDEIGNGDFLSKDHTGTIWSDEEDDDDGASE